jgi:hypothetical protein
MDLPRSISSFVYGSGATKRGGAGVLSYLLFEGSYCKALIDLGYIDGMGRAEEIKRFLHMTAPITKALMWCRLKVLNIGFDSAQPPRLRLVVV